MLKSKKLLIVFLLIFLLVFSFALTSCGEKELTLTTTAETIEVGETVIVKAKYGSKPVSGDDITWSFDKEDIVKVEAKDDGYVITGLAKGKVIVTISYEKEDKKASVEITVNDTAGDKAALAVALAAAKTSKLAQLDALFATYKQTDYSEANWTLLSVYITSAKTTVTNAAVIEVVNAVNTSSIKVLCDAVVTKAQEDVVALATAKTSKIAEFDVLLAAYKQADYNEENWALLSGYITTAKEAVNNASTIAAVNAIGKYPVKVLCDAVITLAQENAQVLAAAKTSKIAEFDVLLATYSQANYSSANWATLSGYVAAAKTAVNNAATVSAVNAVNNASVKAQCDGVKTITQELAAAKTAKKNALDALQGNYFEENYETDDWTELTGYISTAKNTIDGYTNITNVNAFSVSGVETQCNGVPTDVLDAAKTAKKNALDALINGDDATYKQVNYSTNNWGILSGYIDAAKDAVDALTRTTAVNAFDTDEVDGDCYEVKKLVRVATKQELEAAILADEGEGILLTGDITGNITINIEKPNLEINLGGNTYTGVLTIGGSVVVPTGISAKRTLDAGDKTIIIKGGTITTTNDYGIVIKDDSSLKVELYNLTVTAQKAALITGGPDGAATIYAENCTFTGNTAIHIKSGILTLKGGTLTANGAYAAPSYNPDDFNITGNGLMVELGYFQTLTVTIDGSNITSTNGYAIEECATGTAPIANAVIIVKGNYTLSGHAGKGKVSTQNNVIEAHVATLTQLTGSLETDWISKIVLLSDIEDIDKQIVIDRAIVLDGNGYTLTFLDADLGNIDWSNGAGIVILADDVTLKNLTVDRGKEDGEWKSDYVIQVYTADGVVLEGVTLTKGVAGLYVNGSSVTVKGILNVSGNYFGGIEISQGVGVTTDAILTLATGAEIVNDTEFCNTPTVWIERNNDESLQGSLVGHNLYSRVYETATKNQMFYYLDEELADGIVRVGTYDEFKIAVEFEYASKIIFEDDITVPTVGGYADYNIKITDDINRDFTLDLNGYKLLGELNIYNNKTGGYYTGTADITIIDSSEEKTGSIGKLDDIGIWYGILVNGNENINVTLEGITAYGWYGGLYTNGTYEGASITAEDCHFEGSHNINGVGAYLAANYAYGFTDCTFVGVSGIHIKSGTLTLTDCILTADGAYAEPSYNGSGANLTGNGLMVEPTVGYFQTLVVTINGGSITSANGYAIQEHASANVGITPVAYATITVEDCALTGGKGAVLSQNGKVTVLVNSAEEFTAAAGYANNIIIKVIASITLEEGEYLFEEGALVLADNTVELTVAENVKLKVYRIQLNGGKVINNGEIELVLGAIAGHSKTLFVNNGTVTSYVNTFNNLNVAAPYSNKIVLTTDITAGTFIISLISGSREFTIDLNGYKIIDELDITNRRVSGAQTNAILKITIIDSSAEKTGSIGSLTGIGKDYEYGILVEGNEGITLKLEAIKVYGYYGGLYTNGDCEGASITAEDCHFEGGLENSSVGAYLAANYTYDFTDCTFEGATGIHIKSGTLTLTDCDLIADGVSAPPSYNGDGANVTGDGLMVEPTVGYFQTLVVTINGGSITSANGYAIQEHASANVGITTVAYATITVEDCALIGGKGAVLSQNGKVTVLVNSAEEFTAAITFADRIVFVNDITVPKVGIYADFDINAYTRNYDLVIDLNGYKLLGELNIRNSGVFKADITIIDSSEEKTGSIGKLDDIGIWYGLMINGNENINVTLTGITAYGWYGGLYTNGTFEGASIIAEDCHFEGGDDINGVGAYLAANYTYDFTDCEFTGVSGIHIKSGTLTLNNCILTAAGAYAEPSYNGSGANLTGNGLMIEASYGYKNTLNVTVNGGSITSANGYAVGKAISYPIAQAGAGYTATIALNDVDLNSAPGLAEESEEFVSVAVGDAAGLASALANSEIDVITLTANADTGELIINRPVIINGMQKKIFGGLNIINSDDVIIKNLTVDGTGYNLNGINVYLAENVLLENVTVQNAAKGGVIVNGSEVTVRNIALTNNSWGGINVDKGVGVEDLCKLTVEGSFTFSAGVWDWPIWMDKATGWEIDTENCTVDFIPQSKIKGEETYTVYMLGASYVYDFSAADAAPLPHIDTDPRNIPSRTPDEINEDGVLVAKGLVYTYFGEKRQTFGNGFTAAFVIYLDPADFNEGQDLMFSFALNKPDVDAYLTERYVLIRKTGGKLIVDMNTGGELSEITEAGWHTVAMEYYKDADGLVWARGMLITENGAVIYSNVKDVVSSELVIGETTRVTAANAGGNRYGWICYNTVEDGVKIKSIWLKLN